MAPPAPTFTVTWLGTTCPLSKFTLEAVGRGSPFGWTVRYPGEPGRTTVTLSATAAASAGTPADGATTRARPALPDTQGPLVRVSRARRGGMPTKPPGAVSPAV